MSDVTSDATQIATAVNLLMPEEAAAPAPAVTPVDPPVTTPAETPVAPAIDAAALTAISAKVDALDAKIAAGGTLTPAEKRTKSRLEHFVELAASNDYDPFTVGAKSLVEVLEEQAAANKRLEERLLRQEAVTQQAVAAATWAKEERRFSGVDVQAVWQKSVEDAQKVLGSASPDVEKLANHYYEERATNAAKSVAAKPAVKPVSPVVPGGAAVSARAQGIVPVPASIPLSGDQKYISDAVKYLLPSD